MASHLGFLVTKGCRWRRGRIVEAAAADLNLAYLIKFITVYIYISSFLTLFAGLSRVLILDITLVFCIKKSVSMSGQAVQYDDAFLLNEIENGKDVAYPMTVAGDAGTWLSLHHELSTYIIEDVSSKAYHKTDRMETIVKFCQISFAHGKHIQDLAIGARIHEDLLRYTHISAKLAYSALSNLVTRNLDSATIVLTEAAKLSDETKVNLNQDLPIPAILLLRNSLGSTKAIGDMERWYKSTLEIFVVSIN